MLSWIKNFRGLPTELQLKIMIKLFENDDNVQSIIIDDDLTKLWKFGLIPDINNFEIVDLLWSKVIDDNNIVLFKHMYVCQNLELPFIDEQDTLERIAYHGNIEMMEYVYECNGFSEDDEFDRTIIAAAKNGHINVVRFLCTNINFTGEELSDALICAANNGYINVVKFLIKMLRYQCYY